MDTGSILLRMLRVCRSHAETAAERAEVAWWRSQIKALHGQQPLTDTDLVGDSGEIRATPRPKSVVQS